ncbi:MULTISPECIES: FecR domain-containing protein [unclassified Achromobacter]|uniref:FecR domain-containing protein n=1 Tax=unclassified Achromobacter TaxID=2626865 RepID=UPI000B5190C6|nr:MULTISPECIES: FecR family protein [unclassified Achromobacter]OWT73562.1 histidine kinase [Achromobacter sp. HZ34]OWT79520.1 histidine kinase [Achromobacter sp. HZ28]
MSASPWYSTTADAAGIAPEVAERAVQWLLELQAPDVTPATVAAWRAWRAEDSRHELAWQRIESVNGRLTHLASPHNAAIARAALAPSRQHEGAGRRHALKAVLLLAGAGGVAWSAREYVPWRAWTADYRTAVGERRTLVLADGSELILNTDSAVDVRFDDAQRLVRLLAGEILVRTANAWSSTPPFVVETAQGTTLAMGPRYAVRLEDGATDVSVLLGAVRIQPARSAAHARVVPAGHRVRYSTTAVTGDVPVDDTAVAWSEGYIVARSMRLGDFIDELARYSMDPLSCDPDIADLRVSGSFPVADIGRVLDTLSMTLGVRIKTRTRFWGARSVRLVAGPTPPGAPSGAALKS